ncbi:hypothetical protein ABZX51_010652 [Aspergillus tubingensis]
MLDIHAFGISDDRHPIAQKNLRCAYITPNPKKAARLVNASSGHACFLPVACLLKRLLSARLHGGGLISIATFSKRIATVAATGADDDCTTMLALRDSQEPGSDSISRLSITMLVYSWLTLLYYFCCLFTHTPSFLPVGHRYYTEASLVY